jgi:HAE1 family hydrophobic/amphiphilic exporter-1
MVLTEATGSEFRAPMAAITMGGLFTSTLLTLIVVPVVYSVVDAGTVWLQASFGRLRAIVARRVPAEPSA